ncbi:S8 family serine peptidase [Chitinophaga rhizophila]|uniref:S8 family serine peptidase n=1 Tax=Chitinophaga rhizophila TaxID=2866212 RepID=A0ABS7GEA2_9BACT|nr:S8 family serine peptidase [Chitinophaga rhizophila]MBW8685998.1 S8 family serine peptidase [Chitinophaga rhizophila]
MAYPVVAIIDEGLILSKFQDSKVREIDIYESDDAVPVDLTSADDKRLHGTNIASLIFQVCPAADVLSIRMIPVGQINISLLCKALRFCATQDHIRIINISLGILANENPSQELLESCEACFRKGQLLLAAAHFNSEKPCYPAAYPFVYGVGVGMLKDVRRYAYVGEGYINILAKGIHQRLLHEAGRHILRGGTSYATAAFSGILCERLLQEPAATNAELHQKIQLGSTDAFSLHYNCLSQPDAYTDDDKAFSIDNTWKIMTYAIDPATVPERSIPKEQLLYNMSYFMPGNKQATTYPGVPIIRPILSPGIFGRVNTLLLGNFLSDPMLLNVYFGHSLIHYFIKHNGNFVVFDAYIASVIRKSVRLTDASFTGQIVFLETSYNC